MMTQQTIYITSDDSTKILNLIWNASAYRGSPYLKKLKDELMRAVIIDPRQVPADVITLRSTATLEDVETTEEMDYTLVFPEDINPSQGKLSVLSPIGTGMLGCRVGDTFELETPNGNRLMRVKKVVFQPEAAGDFH